MNQDFFLSAHWGCRDFCHACSACCSGSVLRSERLTPADCNQIVTTSIPYEL